MEFICTNILCARLIRYSCILNAQTKHHDIKVNCKRCKRCDFVFMLFTLKIIFDKKKSRHAILREREKKKKKNEERCTFWPHFASFTSFDDVISHRDSDKVAMKSHEKPFQRISPFHLFIFFFFFMTFVTSFIYSKRGVKSNGIGVHSTT